MEDIQQTERGYIRHHQLGRLSGFPRQDHIVRDLERTVSMSLSLTRRTTFSEQAYHLTAPIPSAGSLQRHGRSFGCSWLLTATPHDGYDRSFASLLNFSTPHS